MEKEIVAAYIVGAAGVAAPLITYVLESAKIPSVAKHRQVALNGLWQGRLVQRNFDQQIEIRLVAKSRSIKGRMKIIRDLEDGERHVECEVSGRFYFDHYLKLDYNNTNPSIMQFGSIVLRLRPDGKELEGKYSGYGAFAQAIVSGDMRLMRAD